LSKHKHNYSQYSSKPKNVDESVNKQTTPAEEVAPVVQPKPQPKLVEESVSTTPVPTKVSGTVAGCAKLNVRSDASLFADVVCTLDVMSEMIIDINKSTKDWFYVCTATGIEGYCMRKFVDAHL
jgi:hypothetical protein